MKTILVGDLHLKARMILPIVERLLLEKECNQVVLMGDYTDDWNCNFNEKLYIDELNFLINWKNRMQKNNIQVITLLGNHDAPYLTGELRGYSLRTDYREVAHKLIELGVQIAFELDDYVCSHAGFCVGFNIQEWHLRELTFNDLDLRSVKDLENRIGKRGGFTQTPSPLWADFSELAEYPNPDIPKQIVGHTPQESIVFVKEPSEHRQFIDIDTFNLATKGTYPYYIFREGGDLLLYDNGLSILKTAWQEKETLERLYMQRSGY